MKTPGIGRRQLAGRFLRIEHLETRQLLSSLPLAGAAAGVSRDSHLAAVTAEATPAAVAAALAADTKLQLIATPKNGTTFGLPITVTASVTSTAGVPTGTVEFSVDGNEFGAPFTLVNGSVNTTLTGLAIGSHQVMARYTSDDTAAFLNSQTLAPLTFPITAASTSVSLDSSPGKNSTYGEAATFTASVTSAGGIPTGSIQFVVDNIAFGTPVPLVNGVASMTTAQLVVGAHRVAANYVSDDTALFVNSQTKTPRAFQVARAILTITVKPKVKIYGAKMPGLTPSISGFINGDTAAVLTSWPTITTAATKQSRVGSYAITVTGGAAANYDIKTVNSAISVVPAPLTIVASSATIFRGGPLPALTASYVGLVNGDTPASLVRLPQIKTTATASSPPGVYPTTAAGAASPNYQITYQPGVLTILNVPRTVALQPDPTTPGKSTLVIPGTNGNDTLDVRPAGAGQILVTITGSAPLQRRFNTAQIAHMALYGGMGNDTLWVEPGVAIPAVLFGGDGNDTLINGSGPCVLVGGNGADTLRAGSGRAILIGGRGADTLSGGSADDVLIGGTSDYDNNVLALDMLMAEWSTNLSGYSGRSGHLLGPNGKLNGAYFLTPGTPAPPTSSGMPATVHDDLAADILTGGSRNTWFFRAASRVPDRLNNVLATELVTVY